MVKRLPNVKNLLSKTDHSKRTNQILDLITVTEEDHIDNWLDSSGREFYTPGDPDNDIVYAKFVMDYMRLPAFKINAYRRFMKDHKLFCTAGGIRYRVTMCSRLGTIGLRADHTVEHGYDVSVYAKQCTNWSNKP